jgi:hypothetical protein
MEKQADSNSNGRKPRPVAPATRTRRGEDDTDGTDGFAALVR